MLGHLCFAGNMKACENTVQSIPVLFKENTTLQFSLDGSYCLKDLAHNDVQDNLYLGVRRTRRLRIMTAEIARMQNKEGLMI